jgi:PBP1b-binding outer membrane lipoprotein LpoB
VKAYVLITLSISCLGGCAQMATVEPWEKSTLARETMKPTGTVPARGKIDGHVYYSKEAVRGGTGIGGGGCGCN